MSMTYEDLLPPQYGRSKGITEALAAMEPGDVIRYPTESATAAGARSTVFNVAARLGRHGEYATRTREGVVYVLRLKPEDRR